MANLKTISQTETPTENNGNNGKSISQSSSQQSEETMSPSSQKGPTLQRRLLWGILMSALTPLVAAGGVGWWIINDNIQTRHRNSLETQALLAAEASQDSLANILPLAETLASNPLVLEAVKEGSNQVTAEELKAQSIAEVETAYEETKVLDANPALRNYVQQLVAGNDLTEIIITEQNGFNVAYNQMTSDFVQSDETWWQKGKSNGQWLGELEDDPSTGSQQLPLIQSIQEPETGEFLGMIKLSISTDTFEPIQHYMDHTDILETGEVQIVSPANSQVFVTVDDQGPVPSGNFRGGEAVQTLATAMVTNANLPEAERDEKLKAIATEYELKNLEIKDHTHSGEAGHSHSGDSHGHSHGHSHAEESRPLQTSFSYQGRQYELATVPETEWVSISSVSEEVLLSAGNELIAVFASVGVLLSLGSVGVALILARQLASPLSNVSESAQKAAAGDLSARAEPEGSQETRVLAESYNNLVERVQQLLQEQEETAEQQRQQREELEEEVSQLMTDIEDASEGDLTVRARLMEGDIGIVGDLFNAVVENLQETAQQVKTAASQVNSSLGENEVEIRQLAQGAIAEADDIQSTLNSVAEMNRSIQDVASNAQQAASIADTALTTAQEGNEAMDQTVQTIQNLRATVGETSKKMKQMGESAQKISQVVSLIDEISLKTSLLAINASVEANRAGELGQGFTAVAEQVEALAEQSASAAKEISQIVANIQSETQEAISTMEQGTSEVVESTRSVEETKARLADVVQRSEEINNLMQSISSSTVSQAETSQNVAQLMEQVANSSQSRSQTSQEVAQAIQETAQVSKRLEESVQGFKVDKQ